MQQKKELEAKDSELSQRTGDIEVKYRQKIAGEWSSGFKIL